MDKTIEERIRVAVVKTPIEELAGFCALNFTFVCDESRRLDHSYWVDLLVEKLDTSDKKGRLNFMNKFWPDDLRVCDYCGEFMTEGYLIYNEHTCSRECAIKLYEADGQSEEDFDADLSHCDEDDSEVFWTDWN